MGCNQTDLKGVVIARLAVNSYSLLENEGTHFYTDEQPRRKQRGIKRKILNSPRGGELNPRPPQAD